MTRNAEVATRLEELADLLDAKEVEYKPRAYRRAAENIRDYPGAIEGLAEEGPEALQEIEGIGDAIAEKIVAYVETGEIEELERLRAELPVDMEALTSVEGLGPRRVGALYEALGIRTLDELEAAATDGRIRDIEGFGQTSEQNILDGIPFAREAHERELLGDARPVGEAIRATLAEQPGVQSVDLAGSLRRWRPTIGDVDVLAASETPEAVVEAFTDWGDVDEVLESGSAKASVRAHGMQVDLRVVVPAEFGSALQYFTGAKDHNVLLRNRAIERNLKMNEYGVFDVSNVADPDAGQRVGERIAGDTEESMYTALELPMMPPEMRENRGEIQAAESDDLPDLLDASDIRGDLHVHSEWSDGGHTIAEMADAAAEFGHEYICICDHAEGPGMVGGVGLSDEELRDQLGEIRSADDAAAIDVLAGVEANIDERGSISVADDVLADLDLVVASPHSGLEGDGTDRLIAAIEHPEVTIIGHPTGRLLNQRPGLDLDARRLAESAAEHDTALEVNANPSRLDLSGSAVKVAIEAGAHVAINTDAHGPGAYEQLTYGVHTARRGWAQPDDVINTWSVAELRDFSR